MEEKILEILKETFELEHVDKTCSRQTCPAWDSMGHLNLVLDLEEAFGVKMEPREIRAMKSYDDIVKIIGSKTNTAK